MKFFTNYFSGYKKPGGIKELLILAFPMIISTACDGVMTFTDRMFLARVDSEQMNAAMGGYVSLQVILFFFTGLTGYSTALVAQYFGAEQKLNAAKAVIQAIIFTILAWPLIILLYPLTTYLYGSSGISEIQLNYQTTYIAILANFSIFSMLRFTMGCFFTGIGRTRIVMFATLTAMVINVILDYVLIFGKFGFAAMGIEGAAIATIAGSVGAVLVFIIAYLHKTVRIDFKLFSALRFNWVIMKKLIRYGYPAGLEMFLNFLAFSAIIAMFHAQGTAQATAVTIMFNWDLVSFIPLLGIEIAVTSLVGRYMGAQRPQVAHRAALSGIRIGLFYSAIILLLFVLIPKMLVMAFRPETMTAIFEEAVPLAVSMIQLAAIYVMAEAVIVAIIGALRGAGDTFFTMLISVVLHWSLVPVLYVLLYIFNASVLNGWLALIIMYIIFCMFFILRFNSGKWKKINVIGN